MSIFQVRKKPGCPGFQLFPLYHSSGAIASRSSLGSATASIACCADIFMFVIKALTISALYATLLSRSSPPMLHNIARYLGWSAFGISNISIAFSAEIPSLRIID